MMLFVPGVACKGKLVFNKDGIGSSMILFCRRERPGCPHLAALMPFRVAAEVLTRLLPVDSGKNPETLRSHTPKIGAQLR
jgi:hypothetical protein